MRIFFNASLTGKRLYKKNYLKIISILEKLGCEISGAPVFHRESMDVVRETHKEAETYYKKLVKWVNKADFVVLEVSYSSTGIGHEVALALEKGKPVIALYIKGKRPHVLESISDEKIQVIEYEEKNLAKLLEDAVDYATEQMDSRFNFFISPKISNYLDWIAKKKRIPRAVFLRRLIEKDMKKDRKEAK